MGLPGHVFTKPLSLFLFLCLWFYGLGFQALAQGWVWPVSPPALWPSCLFLASSESLLKSQDDLGWCHTDFSLEGRCDSSLYLTGLCHVRSMDVVVFVWNIIREFESAIWRLCSFCSFYCFWQRLVLRGRKWVLQYCWHRPRGSVLFPQLYFFLQARDRYEAAVLGRSGFVFFYV